MEENTWKNLDNSFIDNLQLRYGIFPSIFSFPFSHASSFTVNPASLLRHMPTAT